MSTQRWANKNKTNKNKWECQNNELLLQHRRPTLYTAGLVFFRPRYLSENAEAKGRRRRKRRRAQR